MATKHHPSPPSNCTIAGVAAADGVVTKSTGSVKFTGKVDDPDKGDKVRLVVYLSSEPQFANPQRHNGGWAKQENNSGITVTGLAQNTLYNVRFYTEDDTGRLSEQYKGGSFYTNRSPLQPTLVFPADNTQYLDTLPITFQWQFNDPDTDTKQYAWALRWRPIYGPNVVGEATWTQLVEVGKEETRTVLAGTFIAGAQYEWQVATQEPSGKLWGPWSVSNSFYVTGPTTPPILNSPISDVAVIATEPKLFEWTFRDPTEYAGQIRADIRYRAVGSQDWIIILGSTVVPGANQQWTISNNTFAPGVQYEWQVRTYTDLPTLSDWSTSATFYAIPAPGSGNGDPILVDPTQSQSSLGCGHNRVFIYDRGGKVPRGEITDIESLMWSRKRDDISNSTVKVTEWGKDCGELLAGLRSWIHEIVIFRDGERVWEGPVTLVTYSKHYVSLEAKDVMVWMYRRIMRQGYDDSYKVVNGVQLGLKTVVDRATLITQNCLAYDDPNILPFLTVIAHDNDTVESRVVADWSKSGWEEIDDMAATGGLDYTVAGRRIIYWDTHRPIGILPEMRDGDFGDDIVVTEYGMQLANVFGVTNNAGVHGEANRFGPDGFPQFYGYVEQIASAYGESTGSATADSLTPAARAALENTLSSQAERNIAGRYTTPVVVRVPDNTTVNPDVNIGINQFIPGVWIPLRSTETLRQVTQIQKLDSVTVTEDSKGETVKVVMSPAPMTKDEDPDAVGGTTTDA